MAYLHWDEKTLTDLGDETVSDAYDHGFVFNRLGRGTIQQTRSARIDLSQFELSSENRRVLKKTGGMTIEALILPLGKARFPQGKRLDYDWSIGKLAKDFYDTKFGPGTMSANKVKGLLTDPTQSSFNLLLRYIISDISVPEAPPAPVGFAICYANPTLLHYSYPFYDLNSSPKDMGLGMMIRAIEYAKANGMKYIYLGSLQRPSDTYKLQFSGLEWFDREKWQTDLVPLKDILKS